MKGEEVAALSVAEKNITIAFACGWSVDPHGWWSHPTLPDRGGAEPEPPDYYFSLDAMHEAEKGLTEEQRPIYNDRLMNELQSPYTCFATARQRADAFLLMLQ